MNKEELLQLGLKLNDTLYVYLNSNVLKVGKYWGEHFLPFENSEKRFCIGLEPKGKIFEWLKIDYIQSIEIVSSKSKSNI